MRYRVRQYDQDGYLTHEQAYRFLFMARISAWIHSGTGVPDTSKRYTCVITEMR